MAVLRFFAALFALIAVIALVADFTHAASGRQSFTGTTTLDHWGSLSPTTLQSAEVSITRTLGPTGWSVVSGGLSAMPAYATFGIVAALFGYIGRRRPRINVFVN